MITKSRTAKFATGFVALAMMLSFVAPSAANAATVAELQAMIASLSAQLSALSGGSSSTGYTFNTNLTVGSRGTDVMNLQKVLNMSADTRVSLSGAGSPGAETTYFGTATRAAVAKFQVKYGISPAAGYVGPVTRAKLNSMNSVVVPPVVTPGTPQGGSLTVSAGSQPSNSLAPTSAARVPFTTIVLTAGSSDVTVNSVTVERVGLAQDAVISGVVLLDNNGAQIGIAKTLNSNHQAIVGEPWVIRAGTSQTITVAANMNSSLSSYSGQVVGLNVVAVNTSASVSGSLPIMGAQHTVNSTLSIGTASVASSSFDPGSTQTKEIGTTGYKFAAVRVTAGSVEQVRLWSIRWNQVGSASSQDLGNVMVYVDGTAYPTTVSSDGKYYTASFSGGILIDKGLSKDIYIQGDVVGSGAAGRTVDFDISRTTDIAVTGVTYGYGITPSYSVGGQFSASTPWFSGYAVTVSGGSVTSIQKATSVASQNIAVNVPNQVLGGFTTDIKGEPITVQSMVFTVASSSGSGTGLLTNVTIVDQNGAVVAGPIDATGAGTTLTFTDSVTFPVGPRTYTIKGKVASTIGNGTVYTLSSTPSSQWTSVTGQTTGNTITLTNGAFTMNSMTVKAAALALTVSTSPAAQSIVGGGVVTFANIQLDGSQSGEDVRFSSVSLLLALGGSASATSLSSCQLFDGSTALNTGSNVINPSAAGETVFTLDQSLTVPKGTVKTLTVKCNVSSSAVNGNTFAWGLGTGAMTPTGVTSGNTVTETVSASAGQTMTVAAGSLAISSDSSTPSYTTVAGGSAGVTMSAFKFRATNEAVNLTKVGLVLTSGSSSDVGTVYLYQGATQIGTATFTGGNTTATSTLTSPITLAKDVDTVITVKADMGSIGVSQVGTEGQLVKIDVTNAEASGLSSGNTLQVGGIVAGAQGVRMFKSFPTVALDTLPSTGIADGRLMRFKVTANSAGAVGLFNFNFTISTSSFVTGGGISSTMLNVYSDASYSQPVSGTFGAATGQFGATNGTTGGTTLTNGPVTLDFQATTNPLQVPAGQTYYFELKATVAGTQTGTSVTTTLNGDAAYIDASHLGVYQVSTTTGALADTNNDFIWSGNATSTAVFNANDWANGYGIPGLPAGGVSQTRSN